MLNKLWSIYQSLYDHVFDSSQLSHLDKAAIDIDLANVLGIRYLSYCYCSSLDAVVSLYLVKPSNLCIEADPVHALLKVLDKYIWA